MAGIKEYLYLAVGFVLVANVLCIGVSLDEEWTAFKRHYAKTYQKHEEIHRRTVWEENVRYIQKHNLAADRGALSYWLGVNKYTDLTPKEIIHQRQGFKVQSNHTKKGATFIPPSNVVLPDRVDWREKGYVTRVQDQAQCGGCWSFSALGSLEGQHFKQTGDLIDLSEQNLLDCSTSVGNKGCEGGNMDLAFIYIYLNAGVDSEKTYPFEGKDGTCRFKSSGVAATDIGYADLTPGDEKNLQVGVATVGPISVPIDADDPGFHSYKSGIYDYAGCKSAVQDLHHAVTLIGYGTDAGQEYWLIKNSWGTSWGMQGYAMIARNKGNLCGMATAASYPLV